MAAANHTEFVFSLSEIILAKKKKNGTVRVIRPLENYKETN